LFEQVLAVKRIKFGPAHPQTLVSLRDLALLHEDGGQFELAEPLKKELVAARRQHDPDSLFLANALAELGLNLLRQRKHAEAEPAARECLALREKKEQQPWFVASARQLLGAALAGQGKFAEAEPALLAGYEGLKEHAAEVTPTFAKAHLTEA